jgi:two-component system sensor histidine kinase CpxA
MKRLRLPIYAKVLIWFCINLILLLGIGLWFMRANFQMGWDWFLTGPGGDRLESIANELTFELRGLPESQWESVLEESISDHGVAFALFGNDGLQKLGPRLDPPDSVQTKLIDKRKAQDMPPPAKPRRAGGKARTPRDPDRAPPKPRFMIRSESSPRYWAGIHITLAYGEGGARRPLSLVVASDSMTGRGLFFDPWPWAGLAAGGLLLSALIWLPVIGGMTRAIRRTHEASKRIASGGFDVRVPDDRRDELGELASSVNAMAAQLSDYVSQQRRITADVAHELCSPIARMQMALGVIEQRGTPGQASYLKKIDAELQHMAKLVEEVMTFSKAETIPERDAPETFELRSIIDEMVLRDGNGASFEIDLPHSIKLHSLRDALERALGNVLRNAVRYAGDAGPIELSARVESNGSVRIRIGDHGPGVPTEALPRLFEPFFRPEAARGRTTGGAGLGLAIVKRCMEACGGTAEARIRSSGGLIVDLTLPA